MQMLLYEEMDWTQLQWVEPASATRLDEVTLGYFRGEILGPSLPEPNIVASQALILRVADPASSSTEWLSGAAHHKKAEEKREGESKHLQKIPRLDSYFSGKNKSEQCRPENADEIIVQNNKRKAEVENIGVLEGCEKSMLSEAVNFDIFVPIKKLASRGLAFHGDEEVFGSVKNGNLMMYIELTAEYDCFLADHTARFVTMEKNLLRTCHQQLMKISYFGKARTKLQGEDVDISTADEMYDSLTMFLTELQTSFPIYKDSAEKKLCRLGILNQFQNYRCTLHSSNKLFC
ncbi:hypothetical protein PR048_013029 [Dryococelus australis]|uniref:Uncharacterized protein n=1 Tax=Dryococelus australis TaxID=614101 RepID=A0ABQ9HQZ9_9NEOP|nr:hypothetical protein PR048_013029 [Dryococelus australis]